VFGNLVLERLDERKKLMRSNEFGSRKGRVQRRWGARLMLVGASMALLAACGSTASSSAKAPAARKLVYFIYNGPTPPYFAPMAQAIADVSKYYPTLDIKTINAGGSATNEASDVSEALGAGAKGIILNTISETDTTAAAQAMSQHVPVITIDRDVSTPSARVAFIGDNDFTLGKDMTTYAISQLKARHIPTPWNVVVLQGTLGASVSIGREKGTMAALQPYISSGKAKVILNQSGNFSTSTAQGIMDTELAKTTNIQLVAAANDAMALGAIAALESHGITPGKKTLVTGADAQPQSLVDVANGTQIDTVTHSPFIEAYWAVEAMWNYLYHKTLPPTSKFPGGKVLIPMHLVTKANVSTIGPWGTPSVVPPLPYGVSTSHKVP
jgi:ABC-type sugar transport system substrate-binding protein